MNADPTYLARSLDLDLAAQRVAELETAAREGTLDAFQQSELQLVSCWLVDYARRLLSENERLTDACLPKP